VIEAIGHQVSTLVDAVTKIKDGGQIYYFGIPDDPIYPFPMSGFLRKNAHLMSGYTKINARRDCLRRAGEHVRDHPEIVAPYLSHRFEFDEVEQAFTTAVTPSVGRLKVSLEV
jgi:threonine dehydrogenase-like Zn-dependent dehydrogenase